MVGETFSAIMASGSTWADQNNPKPVIRIGKSEGESGSIEWSDMLVQTQGGTPGAIVIEYNLDSTRGSGLWDVHTRIGGSKGTLHQVEQCPVGSVYSQCYAAHTNVHITKKAKGAYFENNWFWVSLSRLLTVCCANILSRPLTTTSMTGTAPEPPFSLVAACTSRALTHSSGLAA